MARRRDPEEKAALTGSSPCYSPHCHVVVYSLGVARNALAQDWHMAAQSYRDRGAVTKRAELGAGCGIEAWHVQSPNPKGRPRSRTAH